MEMFLLSALLLCVFILPLMNHEVEENLEPFLLVCGIAAVTISGLWTKHLFFEALREPLRISAAVLVVGLLFKRYHLYIDRIVSRSVGVIGLRWTLFSIVVVLGLTSSIITAIVAALILGEVATVLHLERLQRVKLVIYTCFAISIGAILTPIGEPLGTIVMSKLAGPPHYADTLYIIKLLWPYIISATLILGFMAFAIVKRESTKVTRKQLAFHSIEEILARTGKVYVFVAGLVLLGVGLKPLAYKTIFLLTPETLYWVNICSAALDNATLAAIEIVPEMAVRTLKFLLVSLILGGGMLIPGNIPNIICSSKLKIKSKEWAIIAVPLGLGLMFFYFIIMFLFVK